MALNERTGSMAAGVQTELALTYWSGTLPTKEQFDTAFDNELLKIASDDTNGRLGTLEFVTWLGSLGIEELASMYLGGSYYQVLDSANVIMDASTREYNFVVAKEGTIGMFTMLVVTTAASSADWRTTSREIYNLIMGSVGTEGSGADLIINDVNIDATSTIKVGSVNIKI